MYFFFYCIIYLNYCLNNNFQKKERKKNSKQIKEILVKLVSTEYKTSYKFKSFIILDYKKEILKYESLHNHLKKEFDVFISIAKHKFKEEIRKKVQLFLI